MARRSICALRMPCLAALLLAGVCLTAAGDASMQDGDLLGLLPDPDPIWGANVREGRQYIGFIPANLEAMYGVGCVQEIPIIGNDRPEPFPSRELDYAPFEATETTTLREFLNRICSEGRLQWEIVHNAIHIRPTSMPDEVVNLLDSVRVSISLRDASLLEAIKAWALEVNRNRPPGTRGVRIHHPASLAGAGMRPDRATAASLTRPGAVTLEVTDATAREALCAIQGASRELVAIDYSYGKRERPDLVGLLPSRAERRAAPQVSIEERIALNAEEDLDSVLVEPAAETDGEGDDG